MKGINPHKNVCGKRPKSNCLFEYSGEPFGIVRLRVQLGITRLRWFQRLSTTRPIRCAKMRRNLQNQRFFLRNAKTPHVKPMKNSGLGEIREPRPVTPVSLLQHPTIRQRRKPVLAARFEACQCCFPSRDHPVDWSWG